MYSFSRRHKLPSFLPQCNDVLEGEACERVNQPKLRNHLHVIVVGWRSCMMAGNVLAGSPHPPFLSFTFPDSQKVLDVGILDIILLNQTTPK